MALSAPLKIIAKPFNTIDNISYEDSLIQLKNIIKEYSVNEIVVGLPITLKNTFSEQTDLVKEFIDSLKNDLIIKTLKLR